ncbi:Epsin-2 (EPS-15-interacting protein 2) (Intersectin-EH-binding protein 2) [Fasciola hepatica]|uniref:Epsin-2 (EPS-15-interacting protein 2) (Intersectin-EH-binding protein 2) n=1 Tax=Fasciola hepatica TaxID=6192 RepID=A0A4E0RDQ3_FASHE|nr:Epsin-2 (EPS-15-interacting protein 2) (Intersectin-EH-binding protein 2) [Fasciola hepatica]
MHGGLGTTLSSGGSPSRYPSQGRSSLSHNYPESYYLEKRSPTHSKSPISRSANELDSVRPQSVGEEQLQLQLAIAISKEEHDREERRRRAEAAKEEAKVQMALEQSRREGQETFDSPPLITPASMSNASGSASSAGGGLFNLVDTSLSAAPAHIPDPWSTPAPSTSTAPAVAPSSSTTVLPIDDPWSTARSSDFPSAPNVVSASKQSSSAWPTEPVNISASTSTALPTISSANSPFDLLSDGTNRGGSSGVAVNSNGFHAHETEKQTNGQSSEEQNARNAESHRRTPADFLGEHQRLVDLDKLIEINPASTNPFATGARSTTPVNPFLVNQPAKPSLNQLAPPLALMGSQPTVQQPNPAFVGSVRPAFAPLANPGYFPTQSGPWPMAVPTSNVALPQNPNGLNPFY